MCVALERPREQRRGETVGNTRVQIPSGTLRFFTVADPECQIAAMFGVADGP